MCECSCVHRSNRYLPMSEPSENASSVTRPTRYPSRSA
nr:MAG TPA: hypothetical protein [Caudoviricetes sp.]DAU24727.1 MAG TPA: hypothetical protein [Caudoviricetes sp.]